MLEMVHPSWQAAHENHFHKVVAENPSDGPTVTTWPHGHVQRQPDGCWPTSLSEVHGGHTSASVCVCLAAHVPLPRSHRSRLDCENRILCVNHANRPPRISVIGHVSRLGHADLLCIYKAYIWVMVQLRLQAVQEDQF